MEERLTEELLDELLDAPSPLDFIAEHQPVVRDLSSYLQELLDTHGLESKDVIRTSHVNYTYGYQIFNGQRTKPSRDILLQLAFAMQLSLRETDRLLQVGDVSRLYCKNRRDAIIIFCLDRHVSLDETNDTLYELGEKTLSEKDRD